MRLYPVVFASIILFSCSKNQSQIDVSSQDQVDVVGNAILWLNDGQWEQKSFSSQEQNLFSSLDTVNLAGTTIPDSVKMTSDFFYPNPFGASALIGFRFSVGFEGLVALKYVMVDNHMNVKYKGVVMFRAPVNPANPNNPVSGIINLSPNIRVGQYRIYFTLSTQSKPDFYASWGNIEKTQ